MGMQFTEIRMLSFSKQTCVRMFSVNCANLFILNALYE